MTHKTIAVITTTRADYSHLFHVLKAIDASDKLRLMLMVTGTHVEDDYGHTIDAIKADGFTVDHAIGILADGNDAIAIGKTMARALAKFTQLFATQQPDMLLVLGDRYETMAIVQAALINKVPVAHLCGGDVTEGAYDDAMRHAITKMSHLHFVSNEQSQKRVISMGEQPEHVYNVGAPSLDAIKTLTFTDKASFLASVGLQGAFEQLMLVTYHPETLGNRSVKHDIDILTSALDQHSHMGVIITGANADTGGKQVNELLQVYANKHAHVVFHPSLGIERFYQALHHVDVFIGNSSSGLYEAPSFKLPTVNIGDRQKNRLSADSVVHCAADSDAIVEAVTKALELDCSDVANPYGNGDAVAKIIAVLEAIEDPQLLIQKRFYSHDA